MSYIGCIHWYMVKMVQGKGELRDMTGKIGHLHKCINCVRNQGN